MFTVVCCANDEVTFRDVLEGGLSEQEPHQLLVYWNTESGKPIPRCYNDLAAQAEGDWLMFVHQDVRLLPGALALLGRKLPSLEAPEAALGIAGLHGASSDGWLHSGSCSPDNLRGCHVAAQTLDECMLVCRTELFHALSGFAEDPALAWHCYGADLCLRAAQLGRQNYIVQMLAAHEGPHQASVHKRPEFRAAQAWLATKHRCSLATSGGKLKLVPPGSASAVLAEAVGVGVEWKRRRGDDSVLGAADAARARKGDAEWAWSP